MMGQRKMGKRRRKTRKEEKKTKRSVKVLVRVDAVKCVFKGSFHRVKNDVKIISQTREWICNGLKRGEKKKIREPEKDNRRQRQRETEANTTDNSNHRKETRIRDKAMKPIKQNSKRRKIKLGKMRRDTEIIQTS